jgi:hypothetical protein
MRKQRTVFYLMSSILILLFGCQSLLVFGQAAEKAELALADTNARNDVATANARTSAPATLTSNIDELREMISNERKQIEMLQSTLDKQQRELEKAIGSRTTKNNTQVAAAAVAASPASPASAATPQSADKVGDVELLKGELEAVADSAAQAIQRLTKLEADVTANKKDTDAKGKQLGNFNFSGDVRIRYENFVQKGFETRNRERVRLRFNVTGKVSDEISGGFSLATGSLDDPVSTNQTFTGFLNRKTIGIDKAYVTYKPNYAKFLKLEAGKFAYPWYRTSLTFDSDVNPEGFAQTLSFDLKSSTLKNITFVGFQLPINEKNSSSAYPSDQHDSFILGGQIQTQFQLTPKVKLGLYGAGINFLRTDPLGFAAQARTAGTLVGSLNNTNTLKTSGCASGSSPCYAYKFAYLDAIMKLDIDATPRFPVALLFNFVNNTRGPKERSGYYTELTVGKTKDPKDVQFGYTLIRLEKDAVIAAFNDSDFTASTNIRTHRLQFAYQVKSNLTLQFTSFIGTLANPLMNTSEVPPGVRSQCTASNISVCKGLYLKRQQFDLVYKF